MNLPALSVLGVMSGTSLDGVDGVLARLEAKEGLEWSVLERISQPYSPSLRERLQCAIKPDCSDVTLLTQLHAEVGQAYAELAEQFIAKHTVDLIALSGQTVYHIPRPDKARGWRTVSTLQLGEAAIASEHCGAPVISDFRQGDMAAGGQGAPLVAFGDWQLYHRPGRALAVHNLGGISNLTYLPANNIAEEVFAFDTGPANCLIDEAAQRYFGQDYDGGGKLAARGRVEARTLAALMAHPYFSLEPPKTTGREVFTLSEVEKIADLRLEPHDLLATLTAFTAESVARAYRDFVLPHGLDEVLVAGGGALNPTLLAMFRERLGAPVRTFEELGYGSKDREALAFAVMGYFAYHGLPNILPRATGARYAAVAGKLSGLGGPP